MKDRTIIVEAAGLLAAVGISIIAAQAGERAWTIDPGFVPDTGQINPGVIGSNGNREDPNRQGLGRTVCQVLRAGWRLAHILHGLI